MHCFGYCLIGAVLVGSMIAVMMGKNSAADKQFKASLSADQYAKYETIRQERLQIFIQGIALGAVLAAVYVVMYAKQYGTLINSCVITTLVLGTCYLYYTVMRKTMMLQYLSHQQVPLWTDLYREYQYRSAMGMIIGAVGFFVISWGLSKYAKGED